METTQHTDASPPPFIPSEEWIEAFETQATDELRKAAKRFARMRARFVALAGGRVDDYYVSALVQDALTDTLFGVLSWDPAKTSLEMHVFDTISSRTSHDIERAKHLKHHSIDAFDPHADMTATMVELESSLQLDCRQPRPEALRFSTEVIAKVRELAAKDTDVIRMLDVIEEGAFEARDIMHMAKMSKKTYHKARIRLGRIVLQLSNDVLMEARAHA